MLSMFEKANKGPGVNLGTYEIDSGMSAEPHWNLTTESREAPRTLRRILRITLGIAIRAAFRYAGVTLRKYGYVLALADGT